MPFGSATLRWNMNVESDLASYKYYRRTSIFLPYSGGVNVGLTTDTGNPTVTVTNLQNNMTHYFVISALDLTGNESTFSAEVSKAVAIPVTSVRRSFR